MSCKQCGWPGGDPHTSDKCPSAFRVGDPVYVSLHPDRAPLLGEFVCIAQFLPSVRVSVDVGARRNLLVSYGLLTHADKWPVVA